jgi:type VI secretion system secreted protein VgrG
MADDRKTTVQTPLGSEALTFTHLIGRDEVSRCFAFTVGFISSDENVDALKLLGKPLSVEGEGGDKKRWFSGLVTDFRLTRIEEVCGVKLNDPQMRTNLQVALKLLRLFEEQDAS